MLIDTTARRIGAGTFTGYFRAYVAVTEYNAWGARYVTRYKSDVVRTTREDSLADCRAAKADIESGQFPIGFNVSSGRLIPHGF